MLQLDCAIPVHANTSDITVRIAAVSNRSLSLTFDICEAHQSSCPSRPVTCECGHQTVRSELSSHKQIDCPLTIVSCPLHLVQCCGESCPIQLMRGDLCVHVGAVDNPPLLLIRMAQRILDLTNAAAALKEANSSSDNTNSVRSRGRYGNITKKDPHPPPHKVNSSSAPIQAVRIEMGSSRSTSGGGRSKRQRAEVNYSERHQQIQQQMHSQSHSEDGMHTRRGGSTSSSIHNNNDASPDVSYHGRVRSCNTFLNIGSFRDTSYASSAARDLLGGGGGENIETMSEDDEEESEGVRNEFNNENMQSQRQGENSLERQHEVQSVSNPTYVDLVDDEEEEVEDEEVRSRSSSNSVAACASRSDVGVEDGKESKKTSEKLLVDNNSSPLEYHHMIYSCGSEYRGEMRNGKCHGKGIYHCAETGFVYEGVINFNNPEVSEWRYRGGAEGDKRDPDVRYAFGDVYEGQWENDLKHGYGVYKFVCGEVYRGHFHHDKASGSGHNAYENGDSYKGQYEADKPHGQGVFSFHDGSVYTGNFKAGHYHGAGVLVDAQGTTYNGLWRVGKRHGQGVLTDSHGAVLYDGIWSSDREPRE
eukprot:gene21930-28010_t